MNEYEINWLEKKTTSTGKPYMAITLVGHEDKKVSIWSDFPNFANLMPGAKISGELKQNDKGYWNVYPPKSSASTGGFRGSGAIVKAQETKREDIKEAQGRREEAISLASAQRDAVLIVTHFTEPSTMNSDDIKKEIVKWRNWFLSDDFKNHPPF